MRSIRKKTVAAAAAEQNQPKQPYIVSEPSTNIAHPDEFVECSSFSTLINENGYNYYM